MFDSFNPTASLIPNDGDLVFDATTGEGGLSPAETVLPYIEQRADPDTIYRDAGVVTTPDHAEFTLGSPEENDGSKGETVGVIAIISPTENNYGGRSVLEFSVENYPNNPSHGPSDVGHADLLFSADAPGGAGCSDDICPKNSPTVSPEQVESRGYAAGHFALEVEGQFNALSVGCSDIICGNNTPVLDSGYGASHLSLYDLIV
jgi:hypothetical protein